MDLATRIRPARQAVLRWTVVVLASAVLFGPPAHADLASLDQPADQEEMEQRIAEYSRQMRSAPRQARLYVHRGHAYSSCAVRPGDRRLPHRACARPQPGRAYFGRGMASDATARSTLASPI